MEPIRETSYETVENWRKMKTAYAKVKPALEQFHFAFGPLLRACRKLIPISLETLTGSKGTAANYHSMKARIKRYIYFLNKNRSGAQGAYQKFSALAQDELTDIVLANSSRCVAKTTGLRSCLARRLPRPARRLSFGTFGLGIALPTNWCFYWPRRINSLANEWYYVVESYRSHLEQHHRWEPIYFFSKVGF